MSRVTFAPNCLQYAFGGVTVMPLTAEGAAVSVCPTPRLPSQGEGGIDSALLCWVAALPLARLAALMALA